MAMRVIVETYLENPYPQPVDDGSWEDDGGYVAQPNHQAWAMQIPQYNMSFFGNVLERSTETVLVMHPLTLAEYKHALSRVDGLFK